jgi:hypothetical protein
MLSAMQTPCLRQKEWKGAVCIVYGKGRYRVAASNRVVDKWWLQKCD